ncbi:restriction endonuclease subunit S [Colwellia sp. KU-HH00111]|uniref:restriction endonuclease subunit S n=1 Tax=Colwellia sp. KU-HH00111 TaxID=3127652 RepID=UPI003102DC5C
MSEWISTELGTICDEYGGVIQTGPFGSQLHQHDYVAEGTPVIMPKDIKGGKIELAEIARIDDINVKRLSKHKVQVGDIVIPRRGEISKCTLITEEQTGFICGTGCLKITPPKKVLDPTYFRYYLSRSDTIEWLINNAVGATMLNLSGGILKRLPVVVPPLKEQKVLAAILSSYDDLIENNLKRIKLLEEMAQITFEEWFIRMKFPGHETAVFDKETGLPEGWVKRPISDFCEKITDGTHDSPKQVEQGVPLITGKHIENGFINFESAYLISYEDHEQIKKRSGLSEWDILFSNIGTLGNTGVVTEDFEYSCKNVVIFKRKHGFEYFLYSYLSNEHTVNKLDSMSSGVAQKFYSLKFIRALEETLPSDDLIKEFNTLAEPIYAAKFKLNNQIKLLKEARDILLPRLLTGMIDIEQVELPEAMLNRLEEQEDKIATA